MARLLPDVRGMPRAFWFLWAGVAVNRAGSFVAPFLAIYLTDVERLSVADAGSIVSLMGVGAIGAGPVGGAIADRVGRRFALALSTVLGAAAMLAMGFVRAGPLLPVCGLLLGFFSEMYRPVVSAIVADVVPAADRPRAFGLVYWAVNVGFSVAPVLAGLVAATSFTALFVVDAATTLAFGLLVVANVPETLAREPRAASRAPSLAAPYRDAMFAAFAALNLCIGLVFMQGHVALPVDLRAHGVAPRTFGLLLAINGALIVLLQPLVTSLATRARHGVALAASALLVGAGYGLTSLADGSVALYAASIVVWTLGEMLGAPITPSVIADISPSDARASYQGALQLAFGAASCVAPALGSLVMRAWGSSTLWRGCVVVGACVAAGFVALTPAIERARARHVSKNVTSPVARS